MSNLTLGQINKACIENKYLLLSTSCGGIVAINCNVRKIAMKNKDIDFNKESQFISYRKCDLHEYIMHKIPFISSK